MYSESVLNFVKFLEYKYLYSNKLQKSYIHKSFYINIMNTLAILRKKLMKKYIKCFD